MCTVAAQVSGGRMKVLGQSLSVKQGNTIKTPLVVALDMPQPNSAPALRSLASVI